MNGKMLVKITLNEAIDPDLFAYLSQFDNARLRAGAFRSIASAAVRARNTATVPSSATGDRLTWESPPRGTKEMTPAVNLATALDQAHLPAAATVAETPAFLVDEIGDQFANF
jgi:hypothetical protein